ncbi:t-cell surface protein tactile [Limosa lapponica baueri]|uniref:T-cell surface protein tactile n=1 Tax=Limosa lapponica baueri TaxID=1758121 RepID=A0A2I0UFT3_LIMLA|nr:t-cell surface protein tactile [Limosa lapponica baueri]
MPPPLWALSRLPGPWRDIPWLRHPRPPYHTAEQTSKQRNWYPLSRSRGDQTADVITQTEVVHALLGTDVTLTCTFPKPHTTHIIQTQWSKTDDNQLTRIAVHHPVYGTHYFTFPEASYNFSVSFSMRKCCDRNAAEAFCSSNPNATECNQWTLYLKNVTLSLNGQYECSFATYPYGTKAATIQLIVKAEVIVLIRHCSFSLLVPLVNTTMINAIIVVYMLNGEKGREEELVTKEPSCPAVYRNSSALYRQRVRLGLNNALKIFPTKITDDGKVFSCHVVYDPGRVQKSSTTVRVFAYPEISISLQAGSAGTLQKPNVSCIVRKAFPKPSLQWYVDRVSLMEQPGEIPVEQDDLQDSEGFYHLRSTLLLQGTHQTHKTFSCACLFSFLRNETWNISSEEIFVSFGRFFIDRTHLKHKINDIRQITLLYQSMHMDNYIKLSSAIERKTCKKHQSTSLASLDFTSQASLAPASTTQGALISTTETKSYASPKAVNESLTTAYLNDSTTESPQSLRNATRSSENTTLLHRNLSFSITDQPISVTRGKGFFTTSSLLNSTGGQKNTKASRFPWPTVVAVMLLFCSFLIALGIRKWCQYQKEIMNRPPSFKPPPPPIKYASMVESDGTPPSCHELENL